MFENDQFSTRSRSTVNEIQAEERPTFKNRHDRRKFEDKNRWEQMPVMWDKQELAAETMKDPCLRELLKWESRPPWESVSHQKADIKFYRQTFSSWTKDTRGLLQYKFESQDGTIDWKLIIPKLYRYQMLSLLHDAPQSGDFGEARCVHMLKHCPVFLHNIKQEMRNYCKIGDACVRCKKTPRPKKKAKW